MCVCAVHVDMHVQILRLCSLLKSNYYKLLSVAAVQESTYEVFVYIVKVCRFYKKTHNLSFIFDTFIGLF